MELIFNIVRVGLNVVMYGLPNGQLPILGHGGNKLKYFCIFIFTF